MLFNQSEVIYGINSYKDCSNIISIIKNKYINMASICSSLDDYKELETKEDIFTLKTRPKSKSSFRAKSYSKNI